MGFMDEYKKALDEMVSTKAAATSGSAGVTKSSGGSAPNYVGVGHETFYGGNSSKGGKTFDAPIITTRVTGKKKKKKDKEERSWFKKGLFEDGYDFGDISRTILGSTTDVLENIGTGIIGMGEKAVDAMAYIAPFAENAQFYQNGGVYSLEQQKQHEKVVEQSKKDIGKFIAKDLYDEEKVARAIISDPARMIGIDSETQSVFGEKSDALIQSGGQLLATAGLQAVGVPWFVTTGVTSFGGEAENAMNQDATYEQAGASAAISAGAEILSEKLSGGISFGGKTLDDALTKQLARGISNKLGRTAAKVGLDMAGEGAEEVFSQLASNLGSSLYKEEDITELLFNEEAMDGYLESFIGGAALGGVAGSYNAVKSGSKGVDYASGLTQNEQKVVDKLYQDEIASREKEGKVTQKEKSEIYDRILNEMDKGYISIDTIEEVLGGEKYSQYKQTAEWEDSLQTEFDTLNKMKQGDMTGEQVDRREALRTQIQNVKATSSQAQLKAQIRDEVMGLVKGDRLAESYNERVRTGQKFEADVTQYDAKQQAVVQKAIDSGILNNSNRTHEFVDFVSKISADTGVLFDFSNTAKIREAGFAVEGQTVDGFITKDGITVNIDSPKSRQFVVGHEITHALEGTELYDALRKSVFDYAKMKNQYGVRMESIQKRYKEGTDYEAELTADLVGEYIFSDTDFINNLSTQNRNVFQKVFDEIKYLCKVATAGSKEARELEKVKRAFEKAYREGGKVQGETKYSLSDSDGNQLTKEQQEYFKDSKVRDKNGSLLPVYHGSKNSGFNIFQYSKDNQTGTDYGEAYYFTSDRQKASGYSYDVTKDERVAQYQADREALKKRFLETRSKEDADAFLNYRHEGKKLNELIDDETYLTDGGEVKEVYLNLKNPLIADAGGKYYYEVYPEYFEKARKSGNDGIIVKNVIDNPRGEARPIDTYIAFSPEQIKSVANAKPTADPDIRYSLSEVTEEQNQKGLDRRSEVTYSLSNDTAYMDKAIAKNNSMMKVDNTVLEETKALRGRIAARMNAIKDRGLVGLPEDIEGNTYIANSSYDGTEENTTICPRSLASEAFVDAVSEYLGRPLSVNEQIYISQDLQGRSLTPECTYCYVATDRKAYRAFLGEYVAQRDTVLRKVQENPNADVSRSGELYKEFLNGRKDTKPMYGRFKMWVDAYKNGKPMIDASHLANINKLMGEINSEFGAELKPQIVDAMKYAQSASWAKKRVNYVAYNGHILNWKQDRINKLNSHYGLRMYSFSDFHPAFVLENMQMITDASVRGLKMLGYTKDTDFVDIFAPSGMNINVSTFGFEAGGEVFENNLIGAEWEKAKALREQYPNVGITFVATNDTLVNWALGQDWIDVVIPYHLVRTGAEVAKAFNYTNYTSESSDTKTKDWKKGDQKYIAPTEHNNDKATYLDALARNHLKPRFERFIDNPNYMKLVNECRQPASMSKPVQPVFNEDAAMVALAKLEANGYYQPIGGSVDRMYEIAGEVAEAMTNELAPTRSLSNAGEQHTADPDIRYSLSEGKTYAEIEEERMSLNKRERELEARKREAVNNPELLQAMDNYSGLFTEMRVLLPKRKQGTATQTELDRIEEIKELREVYMNRVTELQDRLGLNAIAEEEREIREKKEELRVASDAAWAREGAEKENKAIAKAGIPAPEYFRKKALKAFKTTANFNEAGYMLPDGKLLNFSGGERNHRYRDHREIGEIYEATNGVAALNRFLNDGNIRIMAESPGIDIASGVEPTKEQYAALRKFINTNGAKDGQFFVDFSDAEGRRAGNYSYNGRIFADRIINDIKYFFQTGKVRESSRLTDFLSLSEAGEQHTADSLSALRLATAEESTDIAPVAENATQQPETQLTEENATLAPVTADDMSALFPNNAVPVQEELEQLIYERDQIFSALEVAVDRGTANEVGKLAEEYEALNARIKALESRETERTGSLTDADVPPEMEAPYQPSDEDYEGTPETVDDPFEERDIGEVGKQSVKAYQYENPEVKPFFQEAALGMLYDVRNTTKGEKWYNDELYYATGGEQGFGGTKRHTTDDIAELKDVYGYTYEQIENGLNAIIEDDGKENNAVSKRIEFMLNDRLLDGYTDVDGRRYEPNQAYVKLLNEKQITEYSREAFESFMANADQYAPGLEEAYAPILNSDPRYEQIAPVYDLPGGQQTYVPTKATYDATPTDDIAPLFDATGKKGVPDGQQAFMPDAGVEKKQTRKEYHQSIIDNIKSVFKGSGFDFDKVLKNAKNLSTWSTVDNTPQRVMEKALGYKEGGILADITVNKVAQNETEGIKWLNSYVDQLKQISKQYGIKPGSKESAAAQMFAEGFYVNENNEIIRYGYPELVQDFGNAKARRIVGIARDARIRKIYDDTLANINASRSRNLYPEIPRLDNYFLHFRAMEDTFSTLGLPFNPNDIRAKDLPTDLNGVTADLKPGQPYFASANHRTGKRTSFDLLGGLERYLNSAKNQIYHIDDIQTLRALRNYIAETYGQATGLEDIDSMTDAEAEERIKQVYGSHLSTFAKFLNEEANVLAGKTALIDRGIEGIIGRRGITFLNALNKQVGSNMVGYNVSSSLTNFLPVAQTFAKTNKFDFTKAFAQTVANKLSGGRFDSFAEDSPVVIRRKGEDRFYRTPWQKMADPGYALMSMVDDISTEIIARTKYNEFTRKGMDSQKAHFETDKWVSRLMGDRSLGQQPQLYNSKMLGLVTKFQLEVRNQLDSQFYDTIQETKVSNEHIKNGLARNAKTAAKVASVFTQLAVAQHLYGKAFESIAGYNPAFDIIEVLMTAFGFDDEEDSEDTLKDNLGQGFEAFMEDLPYASIVTGGGRIPISSALPIKEFFKGEDQYGNEKSRWETLGEVAPYYLMPGGYGQLKKTTQGLKMFSDDHPIAGSYTDAGNLRYDVEDTVGSRIKAGIFGQYASENAQKYFDQEQRTLNPEQTEIFAGLGIPIEEYWDYRDNLYEFYDVRDALKDAAYADGATDEDVLRYTYINNVYGDIYDLYDKQKELASGSSQNKKSELRKLQKQMEQMLSESKYGVDSMKLSGAYAEVGGVRYNKDADSGRWYEIKPKNADGSDNWYYQKEQEVTKGLGISYEEYWNNREEYNFAYDKPGRYAVAQAVGGYDSYMVHYDALENWQSDNYIAADKDEKGNSISGSRKSKVIDYINGLDLDYGERLILYRTVYSSKADKRAYNMEIINYLNERDDISYQEMKSILEELDMEVDSKGNITW